MSESDVPVTLHIPCKAIDRIENGCGHPHVLKLAGPLVIGYLHVTNSETCQICIEQKIQSSSNQVSKFASMFKTISKQFQKFIAGCQSISFFVSLKKTCDCPKIQFSPKQHVLMKSYVVLNGRKYDDRKGGGVFEAV